MAEERGEERKDATRERPARESGRKSAASREREEKREAVEAEKYRRGQLWFGVGLVVAFVGILPLMKHTLPDWPSVICFAVTAYLFYLGNRVGKTG